MKFTISRTSLWDNEKQPIDEAYEDEYIRIDERTVDNPQKLNFYADREDWYNYGFNHRVENNHIKRDFKEKAWYINVDNLEDLLNLNEKYGEIIISKNWNNPNVSSLEIYDDYRE